MARRKMAPKRLRLSFFCPPFFCWSVRGFHFSARHFSAGACAVFIFLPAIFLLRQLGKDPDQL
jgi:hypothetical protein